MATPQTYQKTVLPLRVAETPKNLVGLSKLFEAAVVNRQFCQLLLNQPETALRQGYLGAEHVRALLGRQRRIKPLFGRFFVSKGIFLPEYMDRVVTSQQQHNLQIEQP